MERKQWEGRVVDGRFHLRRYLGGSAHSAVFLTESSEGTPHTAAIKLAPADPDQARTWMSRRELATRLSHPGLLPIFQFGTCRIDDAGLVYAAMELSDEDLSQVIPTRPLATAEARDMLLAVVETLGYLHGEGFVHGCLTPANIMAVGDRIKISTDGLLRIGDSSGHLLAPNLNGPPEGRTGMTPAGDVWSLGMTLVEVLTQRPPVWDHNGTNDPAVPGTLEAPFLDIARGCLRSDPRSRISLAEIAGTIHSASPWPLADRSPLEATARKKPRYLLPVTGAVLAGILVTGAILRGTRSVGSAGGTESPRPVSSEPVAKPENVAAAPAAGEVLPGSSDEAPNAPAAPTPSAPAGNSAGSPAAGDVVERFVPDLSPDILGTIHGIVRVRVRVKVDPSGDVVDSELDSPAGSKYFERLALAAARRWKFKPAADTGHEVESTRLVRFAFRTDGIDASSEAAKP